MTEEKKSPLEKAVSKDPVMAQALQTVTTLKVAQAQAEAMAAMPGVRAVAVTIVWDDENIQPLGNVTLGKDGSDLLNMLRMVRRLYKQGDETLSFIERAQESADQSKEPTPPEEKPSAKDG
jgi:hypothetical protein